MCFISNLGHIWTDIFIQQKKLCIPATAAFVILPNCCIYCNSYCGVPSEHSHRLQENILLYFCISVFFLNFCIYCNSYCAVPNLQDIPTRYKTIYLSISVNLCFCISLYLLNFCIYCNSYCAVPSLQDIPNRYKTIYLSI